MVLPRSRKPFVRKGVQVRVLSPPPDQTRVRYGAPGIRWPDSSDGQSNALVMRRSSVRIRLGPPATPSLVKFNGVSRLQDRFDAVLKQYFPTTLGILWSLLRVVCLPPSSVGEIRKKTLICGVSSAGRAYALQA